MSIATKTGDKGETSLFTGERVRKDDIRVEAYGVMDELNSFLGDAKHYCNQEGFKNIIEAVQSDLFRLCAELASSTGLTDNPIEEKDVERLSKNLFDIEKLITITGFVIPGNSQGSAKLDICRSVARRGERRIVSFSNREKLNPLVIQYVNRLSDLLFMMARKEEKTHLFID